MSEEQQLFKRGNLVRVNFGHPMWKIGGGGQPVCYDLSPELVDRLAIIQYSYAEQFGGSDVNNYSITWQNTGGSISWYHASQLELVDEGGEHLLQEAKEKYDKVYLH